MPRDRPNSSLPEANSPSRAAIDSRIERICRRQKQLIRLGQLVELGLSPAGVRTRVARRRLHRLHRGVFAVHGPPYSVHQRYLAATYACGPGSYVSDLAAAGLLGMHELLPLPAHVSNSSGRGKSRRGIVVHRRSIETRDILARFGIPCTSPARTVIDCAASLPIDQLEDLLMAADSGRPGLNRGRLEELLNQRRGQPGTRNLLRLITDDPKETRTVNERRMLSICREAGVVEPETNYRIAVGDRVFFADFCWPRLRLVVEADSWRWHGGRLAGEADADRAQLLSMAGWKVVRFTRDQIKLDRHLTGRRLQTLTSGHD